MRIHKIFIKVLCFIPFFETTNWTQVKKFVILPVFGTSVNISFSNFGHFLVFQLYLFEIIQFSNISEMILLQQNFMKIQLFLNSFQHFCLFLQLILKFFRSQWDLFVKKPINKTFIFQFFWI